MLAVLARLYSYAGIAFVEDGGLVLGPEAGERTADHAVFPVSYQGAKVAELRVARPEEADRAFLERVATLVSAHCLVGWDTGGEGWAP